MPTCYRQYETLAAENIELKDKYYSEKRERIYYQKLYEKERGKVASLKEENKKLEEKLGQLLQENERLKAQSDKSKEAASETNGENAAQKEEIKKLQEENAKKDAEIEKLEDEAKRKEALLNTDGSNAGIPTSQTPLNKKKIIPNTRVKSGLPIGGQVGHPKHMLAPFRDEEITRRVSHKLEDLSCECGGTFVPTGEYVEKDETDIEIVTVKKRHEFEVCQCSLCGKKRNAAIPEHLKEANQYGPILQADMLAQNVIGYTPIRKVKILTEGRSKGMIHPSEGYIAKLSRRGGKMLKPFMDDLKKHLLKKKLVCWDDTVIMVNTKRACMRFYGDEKITYLTAHEHKDMTGVLEDGILQNLPDTTYVMHDHNIMNYNECFSFENIECIQHLDRDLQKNTDCSGHEWSKETKERVSKTVNDRKKAIMAGQTEFSEEYKKEFFEAIHQSIKKGWAEWEKTSERYFGDAERALLKRLEKYEKNYFAWVLDFTLPDTNNVSERGLRIGKSHQKISGQFQNIERAEDYATIMSYVGTCRKNGINDMEALIRLMEGNPYTVAEIFGATKEAVKDDQKEAR